MTSRPSSSDSQRERSCRKPWCGYRSPGRILAVYRPSLRRLPNTNKVWYLGRPRAARKAGIWRCCHAHPGLVELTKLFTFLEEQSAAFSSSAQHSGWTEKLVSGPSSSTEAAAPGHATRECFQCSAEPAPSRMKREMLPGSNTCKTSFSYFSLPR